ncbi:hypothetical protein A3C32_03515 [Candidatus Daviesbacteria bacterium RIFCSPHIGHO2_02_FULL_41_14]|uniref:Beta-glucosidase n=1 Tax=Candidatus Daviesbacteria bacterium RIFCSPLOWO2_01_FULL_40_24 TaxID=1797787 RepID=A0A1F5MJP2_9BACT|nr:MAG: hypothetical protein A3C32_03515 [Candidatus Daviesbacteria bacterium RIFCSPHIGHO2_02_FULL_41_14]OGE65582.1 MAG: hypothetical protein A3B49_02095 [Candidatus Daviesbacteria bacterium RIFCSPLOWO2_01_FULL_40_24]
MSGDLRHDHATLRFPEKFLWGAATSAFQVEGNIANSDWWAWEQSHLLEINRSGQAADQYNRFEEDFKLAKDLGHNSHRLSLEWSRIEPKEGEFNQVEIEHYKNVLKSLKDKGFTVMLTLHHFSNPAWFAKKGGWRSFWAPYRFNKFVKRVVPELKELVDLWVTINEPAVYASLGYVSAEFPPQHKNDYFGAFKSMWNMARAHKKAYKTIHQIIPNAQVGVANPVQSYDTIHQHSLRENLGKILADYLTNHFFYFLSGLKYQDFIGLNYYANWYIGKNKKGFLPISIDVARIKPEEVSDLGWEIHSEGIFNIIMDFSDSGKPIYITENGIASTNDDRRVRFLLSYLKEVYHTIQLGAPVKGYFYWSLIDNMELHRGFGPQFGLIEIDFKTQARKVRPSAHVYEEIIKHNGIPHYLLKLLGHGIKVEDVLADPHDLNL